MVFALCDEFLCTVRGFLSDPVDAAAASAVDGVPEEPAVLAVEGPDDDPGVEPLDSTGAAHTTGADTPAPIPSATANAPTRPTYRLCPNARPLLTIEFAAVTLRL